MNNKGFTHIILLAAIPIVAIISIAYFALQNQPNSLMTKATPTPSPTPDPTENWETARADGREGYSFKYPPELTRVSADNNSESSNFYIGGPKGRLAVYTRHWASKVYGEHEDLKEARKDPTSKITQKEVAGTIATVLNDEVFFVPLKHDNGLELIFYLTNFPDYSPPIDEILNSLQIFDRNTLYIKAENNVANKVGITVPSKVTIGNQSDREIKAQLDIESASPDYDGDWTISGVPQILTIPAGGEIETEYRVFVPEDSQGTSRSDIKVTELREDGQEPIKAFAEVFNFSPNPFEYTYEGPDDY